MTEQARVLFFTGGFRYPFLLTFCFPYLFVFFLCAPPMSVPSFRSPKAPFFPRPSPFLRSLSLSISCRCSFFDGIPSVFVFAAYVGAPISVRVCACA